MLLDGFGAARTADANAIIRYAGGSRCWWMAATSRTPQKPTTRWCHTRWPGELPPAITGLGAGADPGLRLQPHLAERFNGPVTRRIVWRGNDYVLVDDRVEAGARRYRCCWRGARDEPQL